LNLAQFEGIISLKKKALLIFALILLSVIGFVATTSAQDTAYPLIALSPEKLVFSLR